MTQKRVPPYGSDTKPGTRSAVDYLNSVARRAKDLEALAKMQAARPLKPPGKR